MTCVLWVQKLFITLFCIIYHTELTSLIILSLQHCNWILFIRSISLMTTIWWRWRCINNSTPTIVSRLVSHKVFGIIKFKTPKGIIKHLALLLLNSNSKGIFAMPAFHQFLINYLPVSWFCLLPLGITSNRLLIIRSKPTINRKENLSIVQFIYDTIDTILCY